MLGVYLFMEDNDYITGFLGALGGVMVSKLDQQTFMSKFKSH